MDYCSSCRRHLNGALVCPGCGAYAPDIAPPTDLLQSVETPADLPAGIPAGTGGPGSGVGAQHTDAAPVEGTTASGQGRAARRRQLARWKKHRRRAVVATAVALVGGGLTVAALPSTRPSGHTHAAPPPEPVDGSATPGTATAGTSSEQPDATGSRDSRTRPAVGADRQQSTAAATNPAPATGRTETAGTAAGLPAHANAAAHTGFGSAGERVEQAVGEAAGQSARQSAGHPAPEPVTGAGTAEGGKSAQVAGGGDTAAPRPAPLPETDAPAAGERPGLLGTVVGGLLPTASADEPASPAQVCLIGVCVGQR